MQENNVLLKGFGFSGYRSFGDELTKIAPLRKVNLIIGKNNIGKSNIIKFLNEQYAYFVSKAGNRQYSTGQQKAPFTDTDRHISKQRAYHRISFPILKNEIDKHINERLASAIQREKYPGKLVSLVKKLFSSNFFMNDKGDVWFTYQSNHYNGTFALDFSFKEISPVLNQGEWYYLWHTLTNTSEGNIDQHWIPETIHFLAYCPSSVPDIKIIPAIRKVGAAGTQAKDFSGEGIIGRLAVIQNPTLTEQEEKLKFTAINNFVQEVLENESAEIEIPHDRGTILIHMDGKTLPLESLGTGVHEIVILAVAATLLENTILCVEEPELHLHPVLQRKLVKYLSDSTSNQYFFTTHSAHLLDAVESEIFHVTQVNGASVVHAVASTKERSSICNDLGYRASDILQSNCIIWVEGPSDRIYLNYWIAAKSKDLIEGVHYSIMFYGGNLLSHISGLDDDEINDKISDFISVRNMNRNSAIMFDSDKAKSRARLTSTKQRLKQEFNEGPGFAWVTKGREIENYLDNDKVAESVRAVHPSAPGLLAKGQWTNLLKYKTAKGKNEKTANKVKVAKHYVSKNNADLNVLDLDQKINQLCDFISKSNGNENK